MGIYDISVTDNTGTEVPMERYRGKVLLIVNTATGCGFTPQYTGLQRLYEKFHDQGFEILDFPSNQFGNEAPGDDAQITEFCTLNYQTTFPRFAKSDVNGPNANPLFAYLQRAKPGLLGMEKIKWNFTKFLVNREGEIVARFAPTDKPESIEPKIAEQLN
jgi:glutathione peroxidase